MSARARLDAELVRRHLARSREQANELITQGRVTVNGTTATKPATQITKDTALAVQEPPTGEEDYASRGGHKLEGALRTFEPRGLTVTGKRALDAGASAGGFTDVLLRHGAAHVTAVDVGRGQLAWSLRTDPRVTVRDRLNVRQLTPDQVPPPAPEVVTADLSFISLTLVLEPLMLAASSTADFLVMVKPQFEVGKDRIPHGGVVRDTTDRSEAVRTVASRAGQLGLGVRGVTASTLPGPAGNVEYFLWLHRGALPLDEQELTRAIEEGPR